MKPIVYRYLLAPLLLLAGIAFSYRLLSIPSRLETALFCIAFFIIPTLKYPKLGVYYLFCLPLFIPLFRRMYYLVSERPALDYLMLISDGVMGGLILALILLWLLNKERVRDLLSVLIVAYFLLLFAKVFLGSQSTIVEGMYGFKFNGLYVFFFFAGSYILTDFAETRRLMGWASWLLLATAMYGLNQILFGFTGFEQKWLDSITFTTLRIEGVVRPFSTYVSPAAMSDGMCILLVAGFYWIAAKGRHTLPFGLLLAVAAIPPLLIATVRTNWLAMIAGIFFYCVFLRLQNKWTKLGLVAVMILGLGGYLIKGGSPSGGRAAQSAAMASHIGKKDRNLTDVMIKDRTSALANPLQEYSVQKRIDTWNGILITSKYFPLGKGQSTTGYAHSYYFLVLGEIGYPGLLVFLAILVLGFHRGLKVINHEKDPNVAEFVRFLVTILFMISVLNLTGTHLHTPPGDIFFWFALGCISRFYRKMKADQAQGRTHAITPSAAGAPPATSMGTEGITLPGGVHA